jgi:hypothetical protein
MELPKEFFTLQSMLTLAGATGATFVVANGIQRAFDYNPKWLALAIAEVIAISGVYFSAGQGSDYFVGVINGFLIYCTAAGATSAVGQGPQGAVPRGETMAPQGRRRFLSSWF